MRIVYSKRFIKRHKRSPLSVKEVFDEKLQIFIKNKFSSVLNNHQLIGKLSGYRSINVTGDWRAMFQEFNGG